MSNPRTMSFVSSAVFWGVIIILFGLSIILKEIFHIHFPFMRVIFGILLIFWGVRILTGSTWKNKEDKSAIFSSAKMDYDDSKGEYNIIFGRGDIDLFKSEVPTTNKKIEVNVIFGNGNLILNDSIPTRVRMNSVFGNIRAEKERTGGFGSSTYTTSTYRSDQPHLEIEANAVFGSIDIANKKW